MASSAGFPADAISSQELVMPNHSPFDYLIVFSIVFAAGALWSAYIAQRSAKDCREVPRHA